MKLRALIAAAAVAVLPVSQPGRRDLSLLAERG
jgi:hypothetical protein